MKQAMYSVNEVKELIKKNMPLILAADEKCLSQLPAGKWIAGTIPYFMAEKGGEFTQDKIYVTQLPDYVQGVNIKIYHSENLQSIYQDIPANGAAFIIIPALSQTHLSFALKSPEYAEFGTSPLIGWISGVALPDLGKISPKIFDGSKNEVLEDGAAVLLFDLPENRAADISIINIFEQGNSDSITFLETGFSAKDVLINGHSANLASYIKKHDLDTRLPLVADYYGAQVNISFQTVDEETGEVKFYAPVFKGVEYKQARPVKDYVQSFISRLPEDEADHIIFSCNCILNYLYSELEGKETGGITGPITFGEIAYQLLNQTMTYLTITEI